MRFGIPSSSLPESWRQELDARPELATVLSQKLREAARGWPEIELAQDVFLAHLVDRRDPKQPLPELVRETRFEDLYLACATAQGDATAIDLLERRHLRELVRQMCPRDGTTSVDELCQSVRAHLFVAGEQGEPKIAQYRGGGSLRGWLRIAVTRHLLNLRRSRRRDVVVDDESLADVLVSESEDPELAYMRRLYLRQYREAFAVAARRLDHRQRTLLRLSFLDGLGIDQISSLYEVHRSTAARWLERARDVLVRELRRELCKHLAVNESRLESILRLIEGHIDVTLERVLATTSEGGA